MAQLDSLSATDADIRREGHSFAHAIGIAAYTGMEDVGIVFARCTPAFQSGCYHGVIQAYFTGHAAAHGDHIDDGLINAMCRVPREVTGDRWLHFQCAHGMGHGLLMLTGNHLPAALEGCDLIRDGWERESCYGGVFMENIVHATVPHGSTGRPDATHVHTSATADHDHGGAGAAPRADFPPLKKDDPLYPCNVLPQRYLVSCYQMQTSAVLFHNGSDVAATARVCASAPEELRTTCFQSLGRDISSISQQDHRVAMRLCGQAPELYQPACTVGYTKNLIDVTADPADGFAYCALLPAGEAKRVCYVSVGEQIWVLEADETRRAAICTQAQGVYREACRHGAGLDSGQAVPGSPSARD
jgi:hypothetical protein